MGRSISIELPPRWCSANFLGFAICAVVQLIGDLKRDPPDRRRTDCIRMKARVVGTDNSEECFMMTTGLVIGATVKVGPTHVLLAYLRFGHVFSPTLPARFQPNNCRLIELLFDYGSVSANNAKRWVVQRGGGRLIYKEDVILEDEMMVRSCPVIGEIPEPSTTDTINPDTTATSEIKPPTHPGDHPAIHHRPGKEPAQSMTTTYPQIPNTLSGQFFEPPPLESSGRSDSPEAGKHFASESDYCDEAAVENSKGEPARERALDILNVDDDPPATKKQKVEASYSPTTASPGLPLSLSLLECANSTSLLLLFHNPFTTVS
ncbi:hypothetical protein RJ640_002669 [Escallonia rubra]|uniref:C-JID domain-containing protein n=1 Tax=Escallonia rubra TaxID=112253 RepID=A0AA88RF38_9ASTE|nr:hypothetical protein RJ640_002669 [Escallonia rubra]